MLKYTYRELAKMIDHALLAPSMTDAEAAEGCRLAVQYDVASVCVKPYFVAQAAKILAGTDVLVSSVIGFPAGNSTIETKRLEAAAACQDGAQEVDMVINLGKTLGGDWSYVADEIAGVCRTVHDLGGKVKVIIETDYLPNDETKIRLCEIVGQTGGDWIKTSTGFGFNRQSDGKYSYIGATESDLRLMRKHSPSHVQVKASGGVRDLDGLILVRDLGCTRLGTSATKTMLDEYCRRVVNDDVSERELGLLGGGSY